MLSTIAEVDKLFAAWRYGWFRSHDE